MGNRSFAGILVAVLVTTLSLSQLMSGGKKDKAGQTADPQLASYLKDLAAYDYGMSRESLVAFSAYIRARLGRPDELQAVEKALDALLGANVSLAAKDYACRELSLFAGDRSAPALKRLLSVPDTTDIARYALERIPGEAAGQALRSSLKTAGGARESIGLINSLGDRGDRKAIEMLKSFLLFEQTVGPAAAALGRIGDKDAVGPLYQARIGADGLLRLRVQDALVAVAERQAAEGKVGQAVPIYRNMMFMSEPFIVRVAGYQGLAKCLGPAASVLLLRALQDEDEEVKPTAIHRLMDIDSPSIVQVLSRVYPTLSPRAKVSVLMALREKGAVGAASTVMEAAARETGQVREAALLALGRVGGPSAAALLAETAGQSSDRTAEAARLSLTELRGPGVDEAIMAALRSCSPAGQVEAARAIGQRNMPPAAQEEALKLLRLASKDSDQKIRRAAEDALAAWPGPD
jgi:HEAT repeat protein